MAKQNRLSRDQKRKAKLARKEKRFVKPEPLAFEGDKYKKKALTGTWLYAERGIYEAYLMTDRTLLDSTAKSAVENLIRMLQDGSLTPFETSLVGREGNASDEDLVIWRIRCNWRLLYETEPRPTRAKRIGVLRSILAAIEPYGTPEPSSQGYLRYIGGFLKQSGIRPHIIDG